jgi:hypothetical protein
MRSLSSSLTFFYKWVFTPVWIGGFIIGTGAATLSPAPGAKQVAIGFLIATILGGFVIWLICGRLKRVELDGDELVVSNYLQTVRVPLRHIESVGGSILISPQLVSVRLRVVSDLGDRIIFMPPIRLTGGFSRHPMVEELRALAQRRPLNAAAAQ